MIIGVPTEVKNNEYRVGMIPSGVRQCVKAGHKVLVQNHAGDGSGITNDDYLAAGAILIDTAEEIWAQAELIVKVKEPVAEEYPLVRKGQILFTYFHFASSLPLTKAMLASGATCIAYETIETADHRLPLLTPMSEVAGRMSIQEGAKFLEKPMLGRGVLLSGVPGVEPGKVLVLGGGVVGANAARLAAGMGARVILMDVSLDRLRYLSDVMPANVFTVMSNEDNIRDHIVFADLVVGAVLVTGARAPHLVTRDMLPTMKTGAVIVDVAIAQGGCVETSRPTTHADPVFVVDGVVHYCVTNMPGAVGRSSTYALTNVTMPYVLKIAGLGFPECMRNDQPLKCGVNIVDGEITFQRVAEAFDMTNFVPAEKFL